MPDMSRYRPRDPKGDKSTVKHTRHNTSDRLINDVNVMYVMNVMEWRWKHIQSVVFYKKLNLRRYRLQTSESDVCSHQILTANVHSRTGRIKNVQSPQTHNMGIQMKQEELTKTFMII